ncbi:MAG: uroporphyrinogen-III C-methyltransferase [Cypionkella sp.]|nr:uroporphyrinogen-III C-methyltransferase [Cypionkella sp.]
MSYLQSPESLSHASETSPKSGKISLVGAGPGAADLLTLRALRRLQTADVVFYDRLVSDDVLSLCNAKAQRVFVGKEVGAHNWPQARINNAIVAAALQGQHVVRLKSGDPSVFGRADEEITAARAAGVQVEMMAGITAASAAASELCQPLTVRGETDKVILATATCREGDCALDLRSIAVSGTTLVFYMAMRQLQALSQKLCAAGVEVSQIVTILANVSTQKQRTLTTTVERMAQDCAAARFSNPAVLIISLKKSHVPTTDDAPFIHRGLVKR